MRVEHRLKVIRALRDEGVQSRAQLCESLGLAPTTMSKLAAELQAQGVIAETGPQQSSRVGRPRLDLRLMPDARHVLSVSVVPDALEWAVIRLDLSVAQQGREPMDVAICPPEDVMAGVVALAERWMMRRHASTPATRLMGVAVAVPGFVDEHLRRSVRAPHIGWNDVAIADRLEMALDLPVIVHNNVRCMALAQLRDLGDAASTPLLYVQAKHGLGAALVFSAAPALQRRHILSELGNIPPQPLEGAGRIDSSLRLGDVVNEHYLRRALGLPEGGSGTVQELERRAAAGDADVARLYQHTVSHLAVGLGIAIDLLNPRVIVLGGIYAPASDRFMVDLREAVRQRALDELALQVAFRRSSVAETGALLGAAMVGMDQFLTLD